MDYTLELIVVPVSDVDRAKAFYLDKLGFELLVDSQMGPDFRVVQLVPPGSAGGDRDRDRDRPDVPGLAPRPAPHRQRHRGGTRRAREPRHRSRRHLPLRRGRPDARRRPGAPPYATFMPLEDPDGNTWLVQEVKRDWKVTTVKIDEVAA